MKALQNSMVRQTYIRSNSKKFSNFTTMCMNACTKKIMSRNKETEIGDENPIVNHEHKLVRRYFIKQ